LPPSRNKGHSGADPTGRTAASARPDGLKVAVIGCGYWGKNIVRNFAELGALGAVCDQDDAVAQKFGRTFGVPPRRFDDILADPDCAAVAIATPASAHAEQVAAALRAGKHVFVEKPLALSVEAGRALEHAAAKAARVLMVGHLLHYHPVFIALLGLVRNGRFGRIHHVFSNRLNFGKLRTEEDVIWSFAPHDISMILAILDEEPSEVSVQAAAILDPKIPDIADLHLRFPSGATARVSVSWLNPYKEQRLVVAGSKAYAVFDDTRPWGDKLMLYDHRVEYGSGRPQAVAAEGVRVAVEEREPLRDECAHFLDCVAKGGPPRTGAGEALRVLAVLELASRSVRS
jgi:UDP-2-acetamido-3-amino-2,3-dideoxy-glucuronate N-acetyltransferase